MEKIVKEMLQTNPNLINNTTLFYKKYPLDRIEQNLSNLSIYQILVTQDLTIDFVIKHILLDPDVMDESFANINTICFLQKNISKNDLEAAIKLLDE